MTPTEKAKELIEKYCQVLFGDENFVSLTKPKQCALIAVDEILSLRMVWVMGRDDDYSEGDFYQQVKEEINKL
jgi:hypothetical protein